MMLAIIGRGARDFNGCFLSGELELRCIKKRSDDMKQFNEQIYLNEEECIRRLGISADELLTLMLEGGRPAHLTDDGEMLYLEADIERMRSTERL